ncbi:hypothetical protein ACO0LL_02265 [Undibacterium sp. TC4M20W]|uniref:hypothetical protein n=1 Tax=Undibacterium sp. TC4M20W TaxID=3413052 RepID=UPI003BF21D43
MLPSSDGVAFGYADFYKEYLSIPSNRALVELSRIPLPSPTVFSVHDPLHVAVAAQHGHQVFPIDEANFKARVKDGAPYARSVVSRIAEFHEMVAAHNAREKQLSKFLGGAKIIVIEDTPFTIEEFEAVGLGGTVIAQAAMQFQLDRAFLRLGHSGRLNHFAREYGFSNVTELIVHIGKLDHAAQQLGSPSYMVLCTTSRYIDHVLAQSGDDPSMKIAVAALSEQRDLLMRESVFLVERYVACRIAGADSPFYIEMLEEGVSIELRDGSHAGKCIVSSKRRSDTQGQIYPRWFE